MPVNGVTIPTAGLPDGLAKYAIGLAIVLGLAVLFSNGLDAILAEAIPDEEQRAIAKAMAENVLTNTSVEGKLEQIEQMQRLQIGSPQAA